MDEGPRCERCPLHVEEDPVDSGRGLLCAGMIEYPIWIKEGEVRIQIDSEADLPAALHEWTREFYGKVMKKPGVQLDPRALLRFQTAEGGAPRALCPHSYPAETWARLALEQVLMDTGGMQMRYLYNDRPWLEQPALYTDVVGVVQDARSIATRWLEDRKKKDTK